MTQNLEETGDIGLIVVEISAHPAGAWFVEAFVERIRAMAAAADRYILFRESFADIVEIRSIGKHEREDRHPVRRRGFTRPVGGSEDLHFVF